MNNLISLAEGGLEIASQFKPLGIGFAVIGAAIAVGLIGAKAAEAVGRNPGASAKILVQSILGMALAEGLGILSILMIK